MKKLLLLFIGAMPFIGALAQNSVGKSDDLGRITLASYVPDQIDKMPISAKGILANKLSQIVTNGGMGGNANNERFIITANIGVTDKNITSTAPTMVALSLDVTLYIGDGLEGTSFASTNISAKGVGENETKAYIAAIKSININNSAIKTFLETGKSKILKYYNAKCDFIISDAQSLADRGQYEEALYRLTSIPDVNRDCYNKAKSVILPIYKKNINKICQTKLLEAKAIWAANQNYEGATKAGEILSLIDPSASCYSEVKTFVNQITKSIKDNDNKVWNFVYKQQQLDSDVLKSAYNLAIAYANARPQATFYNIRGWW